MKKFNIGDKVVPVSKTVWGTLEESNVWKRAKEKNQNFIYINSLNGDGEHGVLTCNEEITEYDSGDFFRESDLVLYTEETGVTDNVKQLVENLKKLVEEANLAIKELKDFQHDIQFEIQSESNEEQVPNARQQIVNEAKAFVEKYQTVKKDDEPNKIGNATARSHYYETAFVRKGNKIVALIYPLAFGESRMSNNPKHIGKAICQEGDTFNQHIGEAIALGRALDINVDKFINAVQPTEFAVGQVIHADLSYGYSQTEVITSIQGGQAYVDKGGFHWLTRVEQDNFKILDDTNVTCEVK